MNHAAFVIRCVSLLLCFLFLALAVLLALPFRAVVVFLPADSHQKGKACASSFGDSAIETQHELTSRAVPQSLSQGICALDPPVTQAAEVSGTASCRHDKQYCQAVCCPSVGAERTCNRRALCGFVCAHKYTCRHRYGHQYTCKCRHVDMCAFALTLHIHQHAYTCRMYISRRTPCTRASFHASVDLRELQSTL